MPPGLKICLVQYTGNRSLGKVSQCQEARSRNKDRNTCKKKRPWRCSKGGNLQNRATTKHNSTHNPFDLCLQNDNSQY